MVCGDAGDALGDSIYEARDLPARHAPSRSGPTASRRRCGPSTSRNWPACSRRPATRTTTRRRTGATARPARCTTSRHDEHVLRQNPMTLTADDRARLGLRESATFDRATIADIQRAAETGIYDIRGWGAKRALPHFDDLLFLGASMSRYPLEGYREKCATDVVLGARNAKYPVAPRHPDHDRRHELRRARRPTPRRRSGARPRPGRHLHHHRRRRHDAGGARPVQDAGLPVPAVPLRLQPGRPAPGRRHRDRARPGRQAGRRRHAARPEGHPSGSPACAPCPPASTSARPRRHPDWTGPDDLDHQDQRAARDHRLGEADLRQGRRLARLLRRQARRARRRRRRRGRRHAGRHRRHAGGLHRARRHPDARRRPPGGAGAAGAGRAQEAGRRPAHRLRRHPHRRRRRQGARARAPTPSPSAPPRSSRWATTTRSYAADYERARLGGRLLRPVPGRPGPRRHHHPGPRARSSGSTRSRAGAGVANYLRVLTMEAQTIARACGKADVTTWSPRTWSPLTIEAAAMARVPLAGTSWIPGQVS